MASKERAALALARQDRDHAVIVAPAGTVGNRRVQVGDFVQSGSRLLTLVPTGKFYVVANLKETQTRPMRVGRRAAGGGRRAEVWVDALGGDPLAGTVGSFAPASASESTLLPFEPGFGNFMKIVQRVGVRVRFGPDAARHRGVLRSGSCHHAGYLALKPHDG